MAYEGYQVPVHQSLPAPATRPMDRRGDPAKAGYFSSVQEVAAAVTPKSLSFLLSQHNPPKLEGSLTLWEAVWAIVNIFVGLGLLSQPYALAVGGWACLGWLFVVTAVCGFTGVLLALLFDRLREQGRDLTYASLGEAAMGPYGRVIVQAAVSLELAGATLVCSLFMWENLLYLLPKVPLRWIAVSSTVAVTPTVFLLDFQTLSPLSFLGVVANLAMVIAIVGVFCMDPSPPQRGELSLHGNLQGTSIAIGIFLLSLAGHPCIPAVYAKLERKEDIYNVVSYSFGLIFATYALVATAGYLRYGPSLSVLITENIMLDPGGLWFRAAAMLIVAKTYCSISPFLSICCEVPEQALGLHSANLRRAFRLAALVIIETVAYTAKDHLAVVQAITGSTATIFVAIIVPAVCYVMLFPAEKTDTESNTTTSPPSGQRRARDARDLLPSRSGGVVASLVFLVVDVLHAVDAES
eukprot:CAMPEP_0167819658 /NCGR_PEP_ID=MMETSP0112_2-20121227/5542_1 /TAXON_ID=91324 /ORGANISM="Lotharella globosa, Strain CCCM811" /LENGTH=465 /DNA_ID=CAMNT_0007719897 /DNA_START=74 /DNA_END=1475 /DNA_ORIENTATION=+